MPDRATRRIGLRIGALVAALLVSLGPLALVGSAAGPLTMDARILLQGHARTGSWAAVEVEIQNDGPNIDGELRMDGGAASNARFAMEVRLPTGSHQTYILHAQPPSFGRNVKVDLVANEQVVESVTVAYLVHEANQLVVGVIAERPQALVSQIKLPPSPFGANPAIVPLTVSDLPQRPEGWNVLDRLVWQDIDSNQLTREQFDSMRRWIAAGGRLVIVGGSAGIGTLSAFPDDMLPFRPTATLDLDPATLTSLLGPLPAGAAELPAMAGAPGLGRALVTSGDRVVAGELAYGSGRVTLYGFDPTTQWLAESKSVDALWRGALPVRVGDGTLLTDDSQLVQAVYNLPLLALPPITGLLVIIGAYILIIGPINYFVLKRIDRRELAWVTMPLLVLAFAAASVGYGSLLRGTEVVVNEVAIVRGAPDTTDATAQVYFGVFSPNRATYQVQVAQGALLASPINGDPFGQGATTLDLLQGTGSEFPSRVRNLAVGTGSLRVVRAQLPVAGPRIKADLRLDGNALVGTFQNLSEERLQNVAVVLGSAVAVLGNVEAGESKQVRVTIQDNPFGAGLSDQIIGPSFDISTEEGVKRTIRYSMLNQLTYDPMMGTGGSLPADQAVILAFSDRQILDLQIGDEAPRRTGNVLYYVPAGIAVSGKVTFTSDLLRTNVLEADAQFFSKDRQFLNMGQGAATMSYRPIPFEGSFAVSEVKLTLGMGGGFPVAGGKPIEPVASFAPPCTDFTNSEPEGCAPRRDDFMPEVEVFDLTGEGTWARLPRMLAETTYTLSNPERYVDPSTGQLLVRFVNDNPESSVGFTFQVALTGEVE